MRLSSYWYTFPGSHIFLPLKFPDISHSLPSHLASTQVQSTFLDKLTLVSLSPLTIPNVDHNTILQSILRIGIAHSFNSCKLSYRLDNHPSSSLIPPFCIHGFHLVYHRLILVNLSTLGMCCLFRRFLHGHTSLVFQSRIG